MASEARRPEGFLRSKSARGSPDWPSALISLSMSYSTRRIESVAPSIKRYDANLPTMTCANRLAPPCSSRLAAQACLPQLIGVAILARRQRAKYHQVTRRQVLGGDAPLGESALRGYGVSISARSR